MSTDTWLCVDQGGQSTRAALFSDAGEIVALGQAPLETRTTGAAGVEHIEHDAEALLESVTAALDEAVGRFDGDPASIRGAGLATQRSTLVCAHRETGDALTAAISWRDRRGAAALDAIGGEHGDRIREVTGLRLSPHYGVGKLRWCLDHVDAVARAAERGQLVAAPLASFLLRRLSGESGWQVDPANASRMLLMDASTLDWSEELLRLFRIDRAVLPAIRPSRHRYGSLAFDGARIPLEVSTGDQSAALYCAGVPAPGTVFVNIGTGAFIQCATGADRISDPGLLTSVVWQARSSRAFALEGTVNGAAAAVTHALEALQLNRPAPDDLDAALAGIAEAPLYLNGVSGLGSPDWIPDFESRFVGHGSALQKLAAVYESVVFLLARNLDRMRGRLPLERVVLTGGLARVDWVARQLATLANLPVERPANAEATLRGLFVLLRSGAHEGAAPPPPSDTFRPVPCDVTQRRYRAWTLALEKSVEAERRVAPYAGNG